MTDHLYEYAVKHGVKVDNVRERDTFKLLWKHYFPNVDIDFVTVMNEIGEYGAKKYPDTNVFGRVNRGDFSRDERTNTKNIYDHSDNHFWEYILEIKHDHFGTLRHQLGAASFNVMLEYMLAQVKDK